MKNISKTTGILMLAIAMTFSVTTDVNAQIEATPNQIQQVVLKGVEKKTTINKLVNTEDLKDMHTILYLLIGEKSFYFNDVILKGEKPAELFINEFTLTFTPYEMRMDSREYEKAIGYQSLEENGLYTDAYGDVIPISRDTIEGTVIFRFNREFTNLKMTIKIPDKNPITLSVPQSDTYTTSSNSIQLLGSEGIPSETMAGGFATQTHSYTTQNKLRLNNISSSFNGQNQITRRDTGVVWLAPEADGMATMNSFFEKMVGGGYDLGGGDKSGIMAMMPELLAIGMPLKAIETSIFLIYLATTNTDNNNHESGYIIQNEMNISSISTSFVNNPYSTASTSGQQGNSDTTASANAQDGRSTEPTNEECDCSCEAYAKFVKLAEENKKGKKINDNTFSGF